MGAAMRLGRMRNGDERSPIDSGCGPTRIAAAAKAGLLLCRGDVVLCDRGEKRAPFGVPPACVLSVSAVGSPFGRLETRTKESTCRTAWAASLVCQGIESSKWAIFGKRGAMRDERRSSGYGAQLRANLEPTKGVGRLRRRDGGHGSRNPLRSV
ncbi:hypothetical protein Syun_031929 [Stephania yunnanensis]|uniref:Uncharacterized protein n=1 Tax=Stephania yunnanensis TaxID=152371 RepID=A0AAP0HBR7_9MAGN